MNVSKLHRGVGAVALLFCLSVSRLQGEEFASQWEGRERPWIGSPFWAGPLQDWRLRDGRLECFVSGGNRLVFLTTHEASAEGGGFEMSVRLGPLEREAESGADAGWAGFRVGIRGPLPDYRNAALHGKGLDAGIRTDGRLLLGDLRGDDRIDLDEGVTLSLRATGEGLTLRATDARGREISSSTERTAAALAGHVALVCHWQPSEAAREDGRPNPGFTNRGGDVRFWFADWQLRGKQITAHPERAWGPILWTQYTLSKGVMKMNAQVAPLGENEAKAVILRYNGREVSAPIDPLARTATFRVENWNSDKDTPYSVQLANGESNRWTGTVRRDPVEKPTIVVAGFTGNTDYIFPDSRLVGNVAKHDPDLLFFSGDQLYENVAGYGIQPTWNTPLETATLDYLRKWYLLGWAWRDLLKDRPSLFFPDDHDVYQGNIWGANGRVSSRRPGFDDGGYGMAAEWVNMVQRTQTAHLPEPYDPTPVEQDIGVYYGEFHYGRVSFAMLEDRKFKSGPATVLPDKRGRADHVRRDDVDEATWDPRELDVPEAALLGARQLRFLEDWAADWTDADFKVALSQTIFCNLANYHGPERLYLVADLDSNGWPQSGRRRALEVLRRGFAFHYAGDQHLPSIVHHGINTWNDAGYSFCVPSISAGYPRSWVPDQEGRPVRNRPQPALPNTGEYRDGLGNFVTVYGIGNPEETNRLDTPETLGHDKASGYGIVRLDKQSREITMECWRLLVDVGSPEPGDQFPGWPRTIKLEDNYGREAVAYLPTLEVTGMTRPVVQVIDDTSGEIVYTLRIGDAPFRPKIFTTRPHTLILGEPAENRVQTFRGLQPEADDSLVLRVHFEAADAR